MQQESSSSTLHNYISSGADNNNSQSRRQNNSQSSCSKCQNIDKLKNKQQSSSQSDSSSHDNGQLIQPLHRHIIQHSRQIQNKIQNLQIQIERLKRANDTKDILIEQLRKQVTHYQYSKPANVEDNKNFQRTLKNGIQNSADQIQFIRRQKEIQKIRKQIFKSAENIMGNKMENYYNKDQSSNSYTDLKEKLKSIQIQFEDRGNTKKGNKNKNQKGHNIEQQDSSQQDNYQATYQGKQDQQNIHKNGKKRNHKKIVQYTKKIQIGPSSGQQSQQDDHRNRNRNRKGSKQKKKSNADVQSRTNLRNKPKNNQKNKNNHQNQSQNQQILTKLKEQQQNILRLQQHVRFCQDQMLWMSNFILSFLRMGQKISTIFNQKTIIKSHWTLKKKTKIIWRYFKHIFSYLIEQ